MLKRHYFHIPGMAALWLIMSCNGCSGPKEPEFVRMDSVAVKTSTSDLLVATATAVFYNPNKVSAIIINTDIDILAHDVKVANISQSGHVVVKAQSQFGLPVTFSIDPRRLISSEGLSDIVSSALTRTITLKFSGYCKINVMGTKYKIPVETEQTMTVN